MKIRDVIFSHSLFIGSLIVFTLGVVALLVYGECSPNAKPKATDIVLYPLDRPTLRFPIELNLEKEAFTSQQLEIINNCTKVWKEKSNNVVDIRVNQNWKAPYAFSKNNYKDFGAKTIWLKDPNDIEVAKLELETSVNANGIAIGDFILIVKDSSLDGNKFYTIVLHELGHMVGLEHVKSQYPALMNLGANNGVITNYDLITLCYRYNCK